MGTYTTNYQLYMPTVGEQGWGELVNENCQKIDAVLNGLDTRVGTLEAETVTLDERATTSEERIAALENTIPEEGTVDAENISTDYITLPLNPNGDILLYTKSENLYVQGSQSKDTGALSLPINNGGAIRFRGAYDAIMALSYTYGNSYPRTVTVYINGSVYETFMADAKTHTYSIPIGGTIRVHISSAYAGLEGNLTLSAKI